MKSLLACLALVTGAFAQSPALKTVGGGGDYATLVDALADTQNVPAGSTLVVRAGTYPTPALIDRSLSIFADLSNGPVTTGRIVIEGPDDARIEVVLVDLVIERTLGFESCIRITRTSGSVLLKNCIGRDGAGIVLDNGVNGIRGHGIRIQGVSPNSAQLGFLDVTVSGCEFTGAPGVRVANPFGGSPGSPSYESLDSGAGIFAGPFGSLFVPNQVGVAAPEPGDFDPYPTACRVNVTNSILRGGDAEPVPFSSDGDPYAPDGGSGAWIGNGCYLAAFSSVFQGGRGSDTSSLTPGASNCEVAGRGGRGLDIDNLPLPTGHSYAPLGGASTREANLVSTQVIAGVSGINQCLGTTVTPHPALSVHPASTILTSTASSAQLGVFDGIGGDAVIALNPSGPSSWDFAVNGVSGGFYFLLFTPGRHAGFDMTGILPEVVGASALGRFDPSGPGGAQLLVTGALDGLGAGFGSLSVPAPLPPGIDTVFQALVLSPAASELVYSTPAPATFVW